MRILTAVALALAPAMTGCFGFTLDRSPPEQQRYVLDATRPETAAPSGGAVLEVRAFGAAQTYAGPAFVYRRGDNEIETDFYHRLLVPPGVAIADECTEWLADSGVFASVQPAGRRLRPDFVLEGDVTEFYGEFGPDQPGTAVLALRLALVDLANERTVWSGRLERRTPLANDGVPALVAAWNRCLSAVLTDLERELRSLLAAPRPDR